MSSEKCYNIMIHKQLFQLSHPGEPSQYTPIALCELQPKLMLLKNCECWHTVVRCRNGLRQEKSSKMAHWKPFFLPQNRPYAFWDLLQLFPHRIQKSIPCYTILPIVKAIWCRPLLMLPNRGAEVSTAVNVRVTCAKSQWVLGKCNVLLWNS